MNTAPSQSRALAVFIACPWAQAYERLSQPASFAAWASGLGMLRQNGAEWLADTPQGTARIRFSPRNPFGVLDHWVTLPSGEAVYVPMRLVAHGEGCELSLTLFRQPGVSDAQFEADAEWVVRDLEAARRWLEAF